MLFYPLLASSEGSEFGRSGSSHTNLTVTNWLVGHGVLGQEVTNHIGLDLDWVPVFSTIDINNGTAHLWDNNAVSEMGLDSWLFLTWLGVLLGDSKLLDKSLVLS